MKHPLLKQQLADSSRALADLTVKMIHDKPLLINDLLDLSASGEYPWNMRAARIVSLYGCEQPGRIKPLLDTLINQIINTRSESVKRNFLKIFVDNEFILRQNAKAKLINHCFDLLNGNNTVGTKMYSMVVLYTYCIDIPELLKELYETVESQLPGASAGFRSRGLKIMVQIRNHLRLSSE